MPSATATTLTTQMGVQTMSNPATLGNKVGATVKVPQKIEGHTGLPPFEGDSGGGGQSRCQWDEAICSQTPTHKILWATQAPSQERDVFVSTYCRRHYALELLQRAAYHEPMCGVGLHYHFVEFGPID